MSSSKGITASVIMIFILGIGYFIYNKQNASRTQPSIDLLASMAPKIEKSTEASESAQEGEELTFTLTALNNSKQDGIVSLRDVGGKTQVSIKLTNANKTPQPAHIHTGSCPTPGAVQYPLTNLVNGQSETTLDVSLFELKQLTPLSINVNKSSEEIKTYVSCGDIK